MNAVTLAAPLEITRQLDASLADTWRAWTDSELVRLWFAPGTMRCEVLAYDASVGGNYRIRMHDDDDSKHTVGGTFLEVEPEKRLRYTWAWEDGEGHESQVTVNFSAHADGTRVEIVHEGLENEESVAAHRQGWEGCLAKFPT